MERTNIVSFSGGKDSTALILWAQKKIGKFITVFCDTGWEDPQTYKYVEYINQKLLNGELIILKSKKYNGFEDLSVKKKRIASATARYCTQELKLVPLIEFIKSLPGEVHVYNGIRADESPRRAQMEMNIFDDYLGCFVHRPLLKWKSKGVFNLVKKYGIEPNPLYKQGMGRVGCMPCIMANHKEMRVIIKHRPEVVEKIKKLEVLVGRSFFPPNYIPEKYRTGISNGNTFPWIDDVIKYLIKNENQLEMFDTPSCMSFYGLCE